MAVLYIVAARTTNPSEFGLVVTALAVGTTAVGFLDFGTNSYWTRELAAGRLSTSQHGKRLISKLLYSAIALSLWSVATLVLAQSTSLWMAAPVAMFLLLNQSFQVPLRSIGRGDLIAIAVLFEKAVAGGVFIALITLGIPPVSSLWLSLSTGGLFCALLCWWMTPPSSRPALALLRTTNPWSKSGHYGIANVALTAQSLDIPALSMFGGAASAGIYAAVSRWIQPMTLLASAFSSASAPHIARAQNSQVAWRAARKSIWLLWLAIGLCIIIAIFAPAIVELLLGPGYAGSGHVLRVLALSTVFAIANQPLFVFLQARGFDKPIAAITLSSVIVQLGLVATLSGSLHEMGAALAFLCTQVFLLTSMGILLITKLGQMRNEIDAEQETTLNNRSSYHRGN
ncbi:oligosaccharide flippase family protein [Pseudarthrobacter sp. MDT3-9]|nr:oligosaccharide flippase family protein [Pseudarthrobacter sp. MDT3-9]